MNRDVKIGLVLGFICLGLFFAVFFIRGTPEQAVSEPPLGDEGLAKIASEEEAFPVLVEEFEPVSPVELDIWQPGQTVAETGLETSPEDLYQTEVEVATGAVGPAGALPVASAEAPAGLESPAATHALRAETPLRLPAETAPGRAAGGEEPTVSSRPTRSRGGEIRKHTVRPRQTLYEIAKLYYGESRYWRRIQAANDNIAPTKLKVGMVLLIPPKPKDATGRPVQPTVPSKATGPRKYVIATGDTLWNLAEKYYDDGTKWRVIQDANPKQIPDPYNLKAGVTIIIPEMSDK